MALATTTLPLSVVLQFLAPFGVRVPTGMTGPALGAFLTTLVVGAVLVAVAPEHVERLAGVVGDDPGVSVVYGLLSLGTVAIAVVFSGGIFVGFLVAIPFAIVAGLAWAVGSVIAFLAVADRLVGLDDGWANPLALAAVLNGTLVLTQVGVVVAFLVGTAGFGAVVRDRVS